MAEEKKKQEVNRYSIIEIPTQHQLVIEDSETKIQFNSIEEILLEILNKLNQIGKRVD